MSEARAALNARQGAGQRHDAPEAPHQDLLGARRATAAFARALGRLTDEELAHPTRRRIAARIGLEARATAEAFEALRLGRTPPEPADTPARVEAAATLPTRALRSLVHHAAVHLDVEWRDLPGPLWEREVHGQPARQHPALRARSLRIATEGLGR